MGEVSQRGRRGPTSLVTEASHDRNEAASRRAGDRIRGGTGGIAVDPEGSEHVFRSSTCREEDRPLDGLVNNAAGNFIARTETLSPRAFDSVIDIVLRGSAYCTLAAGKRWIEGRHRGTILSILTTSVWQGRAFMVPSATAKAGVLSMMRSLATEWGPKGIRTVMVAPKIFPTPGASARLYPDPAEYEAQVARIPVGRVGQHAELANLCSYLMSEHAGFINGDCITMDGGAGLVEGGGGIVQYLHRWGAEQWEEFRARAAPAVASSSKKA